MKLRQISNTNITVSPVSLGTWVFGGGKWCGTQLDKDSVEVLASAVARGMNTIDTAPIYGKGRSETIIGAFIKKQNLREKIILATKLGLSWDRSQILHNLKEKRMLEELDESRKRLQTDYFDIYQLHWPDPDTQIGETASVMYKFYEQRKIRAVGVSNYSVEQMKEFMKYCPLHILQPPYNMFKREIEQAIPFCLENNISILAYIPLHSGILSGKFFFDKVSIPDDLCRKNHKDLKEPYFSLNKETLTRLKEIAQKYKKTLAQLALNWTQNQPGITTVLAGARNLNQLKENRGSCGWEIQPNDLEKIKCILEKRDNNIGEINRQ